MNVLFLSPNFPAYNRIFARQLMLREVNVLGVGDAAYDSFSDAQKEPMTEYYRVESLDDYDSVYRAAAYYTHKYGRLDRIVSMNGHWQSLEAALRTDYAMEGIRSAAPIAAAAFDVTYEALVDGDGAPVLSMSRVINGSDGSYMLAKMDRDIRTLGEKKIASLGVKNGFITVEMKKTAKSYSVVNAFAAPAPFVPDMINYAFDFDVYSAWANLFVGGLQDKAEQKKSISMILVEDGKEYPGVSADYFAQLEGKLAQESPASEAMVNVGGDTVYLVRGDNEGDARKILSVFAGKELKAFGESGKKPVTPKSSATKATEPKTAAPKAVTSKAAATPKGAVPKVVVTKAGTPEKAAPKAAVRSKPAIKPEPAKAVKVAVIDEGAFLSDKKTVAVPKAEAKPESSTKISSAEIVPEKKKRGRKPSTASEAGTMSKK